MYKLSEIAAEYKKRLVTADVAATKVQSGDKVSYGFSYMAPHAVDEALAKRAKEGSLKGIEIINTLSVRKGGHAVFRETETAEQCRLACAHFSGLDRKINKEGRGWFVPMFFNEEPQVLDRDQTCGCGDYTGGTYGSVGQFLPRTYSCGYLGSIWRKHVP